MQSLLNISFASFEVIFFFIDQAGLKGIQVSRKMYFHLKYFKHNPLMLSPVQVAGSHACLDWMLVFSK